MEGLDNLKRIIVDDMVIDHEDPLEVVSNGNKLGLKIVVCCSQPVALNFKMAHSSSKLGLFEDYLVDCNISKPSYFSTLIPPKKSSHLGKYSFKLKIVDDEDSHFSCGLSL